MKQHIFSDYNLLCNGVIQPVSCWLGVVPYKDMSLRLGITSKNLKVRDIWFATKIDLKRSLIKKWCSRRSNKDMHRSSNRSFPKVLWKILVWQHSPSHLHHCPVLPFNYTILGWCACISKTLSWCLSLHITTAAPEVNSPPLSALTVFAEFRDSFCTVTYHSLKLRKASLSCLIKRTQVRQLKSLTMSMKYSLPWREVFCIPGATSLDARVANTLLHPNIQ